MPTQQWLLIAAAVVEWLAGLALMATPNVAVTLLLGAPLDGVGGMVGKVAGVALFGLGISCWGASKDSSDTARSGALWAITFYNAGAGLLILFAVTGAARGIVVWGGGALHLGLATGFVASYRYGRACADRDIT